MPLPNSISGLPVLGPWLAMREHNQNDVPSQQLQQMSQFATLQGAMQQQAQRQESIQREQQMRGVLAQLPPDASQEQVMQAIRPYADASGLLTSITASADRRGKIEAENIRAKEGRDQRIFEITERAKRESANIEQQATERRITREEADARQAALMKQLTEDRRAGQLDSIRLAASLRPEPPPRPPIVQTGEDGTTKLFDQSGNLIRDLGKTGKPSVQFQKIEQQKKQLGLDLTRAITELEEASKEGGLIDKSTGSGAGALVDMAAGFVGQATPGAVAVGQLKPIYDLALKMVPRFEGPQSDKDTKSYEQASGQLANPAVPNDTKKAAAKEIVRLMKQRRSQFVSKDMVEIPAASASPAGPKFLGFE